MIQLSAPISLRFSIMLTSARMSALQATPFRSRPSTGGPRGGSSHTSWIRAGPRQRRPMRGYRGSMCRPRWRRRGRGRAWVWATAAQTPAVAWPSPWPSSLCASAASSSAWRKCSGPVIGAPLVVLSVTGVIPGRLTGELPHRYPDAPSHWASGITVHGAGLRCTSFTGSSGGSLYDPVGSGQYRRRNAGIRRLEPG